MSFRRFGLLRSQPRLVGGLTRAGMNGMPLFHQRFGGTGGGNGAASKVGTGVFIAIAGAAATGYVGFEYYKKQQDHVESRNFEKFLNGHHIPPNNVPYEIERKVNKAVERDILEKAGAPSVVNIVGDKNLGKSVAVNIAAQSINKNHYRQYKVFYIDASETFQAFLQQKYKLDYPSECEAVKAWMKNLGTYATEHPLPRILVILDSPGSWDKALDADTMNKLMRFMKYSVASNAMTFYCISSEETSIFTKERIKVLGTRYNEISQEEWGIDFALTVDEKEELIKKYLATDPSKKLTSQAKEELRLNETNAIGVFIKEIAWA